MGERGGERKSKEEREIARNREEDRETEGTYEKLYIEYSSCYFKGKGRQ